MELDKKAQLLQDKDFLELARRKTRITAILTALTLASYYGYIFLIAFRTEILGYKFTTNVTLGIPLGIGVIVFSWVLTGIYVRWANRNYDVMVKQLKQKLEGNDDDRNRAE